MFQQKLHAFQRIIESPVHFTLVLICAGLPGRGFPGPPGTLGFKGWSPFHYLFDSLPQLAEQTRATVELFFLAQVTKVVRAFPAVQVIQVYPESKVTRASQVYRVFRVSLERGASLGFLWRDPRARGERKENLEKQVLRMHTFVGLLALFWLRSVMC